MMRQKTVMMLLIATMFGCIATLTAERIVPEQGYTWGLNNQKALTLDSGQIITEAVLTFHNFRSDLAETTTTTSGTTRTSFRSTTTSTVTGAPNFESLRVYVLDNPRYGFLPLRQMSYADPFAGFGCQVDGVYANNNLVYRLGQTHDQDSYFSQVFGDAAQFLLTNGTSVSLSSALLEFIDYAGTGPSVGFGIWPGSVGYDYDDITLELTVQSHMGQYTSYSLVYHLADDMSPVDDHQTPPDEQEDQDYTLAVLAAHGDVVVSPNQATYSHGQTVTLTAAPDAGYSFANWSGDASGTAGTITVTMNGDKAITANFTQNAGVESHTLSITAENGSVTKRVNGVLTTATSFAAGTVVELTANPNTGYEFSGWAGDVSGTSATIMITINDATSATANFSATVTRSSFRR